VPHEQEHDDRDDEQDLEHGERIDPVTHTRETETPEQPHPPTGHVPVFGLAGPLYYRPDGTLGRRLGPGVCGGRLGPGPGALMVEGCGEDWPCSTMRAAGWLHPYAPPLTVTAEATP
jgi:hypothetical protein